MNYSLPGVEGLRESFNAARDKWRLLLVLSPTCEECLDGAATVASAAPLEPVYVLWLGMRPGDGPQAAIAAASELPQTFAHFWEEEGWPVSTALRPILGLGDYDAERSAWDVYLLYEAGVSWTEGPPVPKAWAHNLNPDPGIAPRISEELVRRWFRDAD